MLKPTPTQALIDALQHYDESTRGARVERIIVAGEYSTLPSVFMGRSETLHLLEETRRAFVDGHFAATLMLAISVIEHCIVEECQLRGIFKESPPLGKVLEIAKDNSILPVTWFSEIMLLVKRRNPFAHLKASSHEHTLGMRTRVEKRHPTSILEEDAENALKYMYLVFRATLREAAEPGAAAADDRSGS